VVHEKHILLGEIALPTEATPPIPTHFCVAWSVSLSHSCTLLQRFDEIRCHLTGTLVGSNDSMYVLDKRGLWPGRKREIWGQTPSQNLANTNERFRLSPN